MQLGIEPRNDFVSKQLLLSGPIPVGAVDAKPKGKSETRKEIKNSVLAELKACVTVETKVCPRCGKEKKAEDFNIRRDSPDGLQGWCICCKREDDAIRASAHYFCGSCGQSNRLGEDMDLRKPKLCPMCQKGEKPVRVRRKRYKYEGSRYFNGAIIHGWVLSASKRDHTWGLTRDHLDHQFEKQNWVCALSGEKMDNVYRSTDRFSLDRKDSTRGYEPDNIQFVRYSVNVGKSNLDEQAYLNVCREVVAHHDKKQGVANNESSPETHNPNPIHKVEQNDKSVRKVGNRSSPYPVRSYWGELWPFPISHACSA